MLNKEGNRAGTEGGQGRFQEAVRGGPRERIGESSGNGEGRFLVVVNGGVGKGPGGRVARPRREAEYLVEYI